MHIPVTIFNEEELRDFLQINTKHPDFMEIECGCTSRKYGDTIGHLRIFAGGNIEVTCQCSDQCKNVTLSGVEFVKHVKRLANVADWRNQIWVLNKEGKKVKLPKTCLLRYYREPFHRPLRGLTVHRDEFLRCTRCGKERRFSLRTAQECRVHHNALLNPHRMCSNMFPGGMRCRVEEERQSRKACRGCPSTPRCRGCVRCVCFGCSICRFEDCNCRTCVDFLQEAVP